MLEQFVRNQARVQRLRVGALGAHLESFVTDLQGRGHAARTIQEYLAQAGRFARWFEGHGYSLNELAESDVERFLRSPESKRRSVRTRRSIRRALRRLLLTLRAKGVVAATARVAADGTAAEGLLQQFREHARSARGLTDTTCIQQSRRIREFLAWLFPTGEFDPAAITAHCLMAFVAGRAALGKTRAAQSDASALRGFLRFLVLRGTCNQEIIAAVPTVAHRPVRLPRCLASDQVRQLLSSFDRAQPTGRRDYAITLCLMSLGLRIGNTYWYLTAVPELLSYAAARFEQFATCADTGADP